MIEDATRTDSEHEGVSPPVGAVNDRRHRRYLANISRFSGVYVWGLLVLVFGLWVPHTFLTLSSVRSVSSNQAVTAILAVALIFPLAAGAFDLSVAAMLGVAEVEVLELQVHHVNSVLAVFITIVTGLVVGGLNGFVVVRLRVNSFIATLGMSSVLAAVAFAITGGNTVAVGFSSNFLSAGQDSFLTIPNPVWYFLVVAVLAYYVLEFLTVGRYLYSTGGNPEATRLVGVRVDRIVFGTLVTSGGLSAIAGVVLAAQLANASPTVGPGFLLPAFSAVFLGSTQVKLSGRVNVIGTVIGIVLLSTGIEGLQLVGAPSYVSDLFNGLALIIAVALSRRPKAVT